MIRINLLPVKTSRKAEAGRNQLILFVVVLIGVAVGNAWWWQTNASDQQRLKEQVAHTQDEIKKLDKVIAEVKDINEKERDLDTKMDALKQLKTNRAGPVKVLDAFQTAMPKKVWITSIKEAGGAMHVEGVALSQDDLAEFMSALQNVVDTPSGIGRLVQSDSASDSRVEISTGNVEVFKATSITPFFTNVQLVGDKESTEDGVKTVKFGLNLSANYAA